MPFIKTDNFTTMIYEYNRGDKMIKADPAVIWRKMTGACRLLGETFNQLMVKWNDTVVKEGDMPEDIERKISLFSEIEPKIEQMAREAFGIPPIDEDGHGGTVALVLATLNDFVTDNEKKRESTEILPSLSASMDGDHPDFSRESSGSNA